MNDQPEAVRKPYARTAHSERYGMSLPGGKTCGECLHFPRCRRLFGAVVGDETCDFSPSLFRERP